jgi:competence protein ComEA
MAQAQMVAGEPLDLNRASVEELVALIGLNEMIAESIIDFRDANGGFHSVEDLLEVEGFNEGWYERIRLMVTA